MKSPAKSKLAVFDIDGTLFRNSLLIELHWQLIKEGVLPKKVKEEVDDSYWAWVNREGHYDDYLNQVIKTFKENIATITEEKMAEVAQKVVEKQSKIVYRFTRDLIEEIRGEYILLALSGSPEVMVEEFTKQWSFDHFIGTNYEIKNGKYTGKVPFVASEDKRHVLESFIEEKGLTAKGSIGTGDTESDIGIFEVVERAICFNPTKKLYEIAKGKNWEIVVERKDVIYTI
jgi:HAD superfamily hydrolase (TIGR01490 family)